MLYYTYYTQIIAPFSYEILKGILVIVCNVLLTLIDIPNYAKYG